MQVTVSQISVLKNCHHCVQVGNGHGKTGFSDCSSYSLGLIDFSVCSLAGYVQSCWFQCLKMNEYQEEESWGPVSSRMKGGY